MKNNNQMPPSLRIKWCILRTSIEERLVYRADFAFATLVRFLPIVTQVFLWSAIYRANSPTDRKTINGYTYGDMVAYSLLVMVGRAFSSMPGLTTGIARDVRDGSIKRFLVQPIDLLDYLFWHRVAHKLVYYFVATLPFAFVFWLCRDYFHGWPDALTLLGAFVSLILAFLIGFLIESLMGLCAFWFLEVSSLVFVYMLLSYFLSGHMLPLDWLPAPFGDAIQVLPFKYLAFVPAAILLQKYSHAQLAVELCQGIVWVLVLLALNRLALTRGLRRYSAYGG
jgi:ABC-2 type transport system permease protein